MKQPGMAKQWEVSGTAREGQTVGGELNSQGVSNSGGCVEQPGRAKQWEVSGTAREGQTVGGEWNSQGGPNSGR